MKYYIHCNNPTTLDGSSMVSFPLISCLPLRIRGKWFEQVQKFALRYASPAPVYSARSATLLWIAENQRNPEQFPLLPTSSATFHTLLKNLRRACYEQIGSSRVSLSYASGQWLGLIILCKHLCEQKLLPYVDWNSGAYKAFPNRDPGELREAVRANVVTDLRMIPKKLSVESDAFHTDLLVPLSLHLNHQEYLDEYEKKLGDALDQFRNKALQECEQMQFKSELGKGFIENISNDVDSDRSQFVASANLEASNFNANELASLPFIADHLRVVKSEMNCFPLPYISKLKLTGAPIKGARALAAFGKDKVLPYLGLMNARSAIPIIVLIMIENPRVNVASLLSAKIVNSQGQEILISNAGEGEDFRISVDKPRAQSQMHSILSKNAVSYLNLVIEWTRPIRERLINEGRFEEAQYLWIGFVQSKTYTIGRLSINNLRNAFRVPLSRSIKKKEVYERTLKPRSTRSLPSFIESHPSLMPWATTATLKSLRVSAGVYKWFQSKGDIETAAKAFGHKDIKTTLGHYIPQPLQAAMYEQQIRRWQNILICAAAVGKDYLLEATDFSTTEELHVFISSFFSDSAVSPLSSTTMSDRLPIIAQRVESFQVEKFKAECSGKLVMAENPDPIALLFLYREHLLESYPSALDIPDAATKTAPRLWLDFADALLTPKLDVQRPLVQLVEKAKERLNDLRGKVVFPKWIQ
ncbi:MAG: hypothetical protein JWM78_3846 [Verrucomicrobiaceae bacterium]|nr:hypothetical protein [Verrucomicrobiaceae bacterium]